MKKKKGFIFVETIVVVAVLITSLMYLYSSYITLTNSESRRLLYDDVAYLYRTYYVKKYFVSQRMDRIVSQLSNEDRSDNANFMISFGCGSKDVFDRYEKESGFCEIMSQELHIANIYFTYYDLSVLQDCDTNHSNLCSTFSRVNSFLAGYLKTLGGKGEAGYRMIVEYQEDGKGNICTDQEHCKYYYSTVKVGDSL